jgi:hypothetical protein
MAAQCYPCKTKVGTLSVSWGIANEPVGCCKICHVLACGLHGTRVKSGPTFVCVECQPSLLTASAATLVTNMDNTIQYLKSLIESIPKEWLYKSLEDFIKKNPDYQKWIEGVENYTINWETWNFYDEFRALFQNSGFVVQQLLISAALILKNLYKGDLPDDYSQDFILLRQSINDNNLNSNNEREFFVTQ